MKKILSFVLVMALLLGMCSITAFATEGDKPTPVPTTGPWDGFFWMTGGPMISFGGVEGQDERLVYYRQGWEMSSPIITDNEAVPGATYDKATNTLTLDNVKLPDTLSLYYMGDDFKLRVVGECELGYIRVNNYFNNYSTSLNITGTGTLSVNKDKKNDEAMYFYADGEGLMHLDIAPSVTVHLYANENASESESIPQNVMRIWSTYADPAITVGGEAIPEAKSRQKTETIYETVNAAWYSNPDYESYRGKRVTSKTDPDGIYAVEEVERYTGEGYEPGWCVTKYNTYPKFDTPIPDPAYTNEYGDRGIVLTKEEFEAGYDYYEEEQPVKIRYTSDYREENRGYRGVKFIKDGDPDTVYIGQKNGWNTWYQGDLGDISSYYLYKAHWDEDEQLYFLDGDAVERNKTEEQLKDAGYTIATEEVEGPLTMICWEGPAPYDDDNNQRTVELVSCKSDPDGMYAFMYKSTYVDTGEVKVHITPIVYDEDNDEYYLQGYHGGYIGTDIFVVPEEEWESGDCDFAYITGKKEQRVELQYITEYYDYEDYSTEAFLMTKDGEPGQYYGAELWDWADGHKEYVVEPIEWREDKERYYSPDSADSESYDSVEAMETAGYHMVMEDQPVDYTVTGSVTITTMSLYKDDEGNSYFKDYDDMVYRISEDNIFTYGDKEYYIGTLAEDVDPDDLHDIHHEETRDDYTWWIEGTEYHHTGTGKEVYDLWVNGEQVTSDHLTITCGKGTAVYDPVKNTLTLNNAEITKGADKDWTYSGVLSQMDDLTVIINGDCTITNTNGDGIGTYNNESYQIGNVIYPMPYDITVTGDGTLTINESTPMYGYGLYCTGNLVIDGITLHVNSAAAGVWASDLKMNKVNADIKTTSWYSGIVVNRGDFIFENSTVTAESADGAGLLLGSDLMTSALTVSSGELSLSGKIGVQGIVDKSTVTVNGGKLSVEGSDKAFDDSFLADNAKNIVMGEGIGVVSGSLDSTNCVIAEEGASSGFTVSGKATSYKTNEGVDDVTLKLTGSDNNYTEEVIVTATYKGIKADTDYSFENVPAGNYVLSVAKGNHVTREYEVAVSADTTQDVKICPIGDADNNGRVNSADAKAAFQHGNEQALITDPYKLACADVASPKKRVNSADAKAIFQHGNEQKSLWTVTAE